MTRPIALAVLALLATAAFSSRVCAQSPGGSAANGNGGFGDVGQDIEAHSRPDDWTVELHGYMRLRAETLYNLDLDRGPTPSGQPLFPVPIDDPNGQSLSQADMRLRTDVSVYAPGGGVAVHLRVDTLDNLMLGSTPDGVPSASTSQRTLDTPFRVRRAYATVLTPVGVIAAGRMPNHFGLGMLANSGDCLDCDSGDVADRVAFATPLVGHVWAAAFDLTATGPFSPRASGFRGVDVAPSADVRTLTFVFLKWLGEASRTRRQRAGRTTVEYGAYVSHRWQDGDVPASYLPTALPVELTGAQVVPRDFHATAAAAWLRVQSKDVRIELEAAFLYSRIGQPSLVPGVLYRDAITGTQFGAALETDFMSLDGPFSFGIDGGFASGDSAPGFGAFPRLGQAAPRPGDLDGPQASLPGDTTVNNFRFSPDYRIDRILFREILGTVTDAFYFRPHLRLRIFSAPFGTLEAQLFAVASFAVEPTSAPGQDRPLGIELDPTLVYRTRDGFLASLEYAVLAPLSGLDNPDLGLRAQPAQLLRLRVQYLF